MDIFEFAMQMEKEGKEFYEKAMSHAKTQKEKSLLERLIREEEQHYGDKWRWRDKQREADVLPQ